MKKPSSIVTGPVKTKWIQDNLSPVTEQNYRNLLLMGRLVYVVIKHTKTDSAILNFFEIRQRLLKGKYVVTNLPGIGMDFELFIHNEESIEDFKRIGDLIMTHIKNGMLYINQKDKYVKYRKL